MRLYLLKIVAFCLSTAAIGFPASAKLDRESNHHSKQPASYTTDLAQNTATEAVNQGVNYEQSGQTDLAIAAYKKAIELDPQSADAFFNLGVVYFRTEQYDQSIQNFSQAITFNPQDAEAYRNRGKAYEKKAYVKSGKYHYRSGDAISDYEKAVELDPQYFDAHCDLGVAQLAFNSFHYAVENFTEAIGIEPTSAEAYYNRGIAYTGKDEPVEALADYDKAIELNPEYAEAYYARGAINFDELEDTTNPIGNLTQSKQDLEKAAQLSQAQGNTELYETTQQSLQELASGS